MKNYYFTKKKKKDEKKRLFIKSKYNKKAVVSLLLWASYRSLFYYGTEPDLRKGSKGLGV